MFIPKSDGGSTCSFQKMSGSKGPYVRIQVDESFLDKIFKQVEVRLDRHEEMILELQRLMRDKADRSDLKDLRESFVRELESKTLQLNTRIAALESKFDSRLKVLEEQFENRLLDMSNLLNLTMRQRFDDLESRIPKGAGEVGELSDRLQSLEQTVFANGKKLHTTRESVQHIASSIALFNNTTATLDNALPEVLHQSVNSVKSDIQSLVEQLNKLRDQLKTLEILKNRAPADPTIIHHEKRQPDFDITAIRPYPSVAAHWRDAPELPPIHPFMNIGEVVDYVYRLVPKLQAHLTAMHGRIVETSADLVGKVDKSLVEKMFEKFQSVIGEMASRVDDLKDCVEQTATREEINDLLEDILNSMSHEGQTAVGRMKCMACGRDIPQVTGAVTEQEARRTLGSAPNSVVFKGAGLKVGVQYQTKDGFDSGIIESPRSTRPFKAASKSLKHGKPRSPRQ
jgi:hypothetical protein